MREFSNLVYLDLQKTATTSIVYLLRQVIDEPEKQRDAHSGPEAGHDVSKFHFISVRNPLSTYISWFSYGLSGKGGLYRVLEKKGRGGLYKPSILGFSKWLDFMLDDKNAATIRRKYANSNISQFVGPLSHRLILLSIVDATQKIKNESFKDASDIVGYFNDSRIYSDYVRTENLLPDLLGVFNRSKPKVQFSKRFGSLQTVDELKALLPVINVSKKVNGLNMASVSQELQDRILERERLFYDVFGYRSDERGAQPPL